jgi:hypothetical protein
MTGPYYMLFSLVGYCHLVLGHAETVADARKQIAEDFEVNIEDVEYECTLTEFDSIAD